MFVARVNLSVVEKENYLFGAAGFIPALKRW
jgi:hypothetical protein